jgi:hypothetical protein
VKGPRASSALAALASLALACSDGGGPGPAPRTFLMGFSPIPPKPDLALLLANVDSFRRRSDAAILHQSVPWAALLAGIPADSAVRSNEVGLANLFRAYGLRLVITVDVTDGLARDREAPELVAAGRSIADPAVQALYRDYVLAVATLVEPDYLGLAAETNLIRAAAPDSVYAALVAMTNAAAADLATLGVTSTPFVSVQVEVAWGRLGSGTYEGVGTDLQDFPFIEALGLSSYPYLGGFAQPEDVPADYYARLATESSLPVLVVEGGWPSTSVAGQGSTPAEQARYIARQTALLDAAGAAAVFQLTFTDLHPSIFPPGSILPLFATLGLVDTALAPKPALATWDAAFARPRVP